MNVSASSLVQSVQVTDSVVASTNTAPVNGSVISGISQVQVGSCEQEAKAPTAKKAKNTFFMIEKFRLEYHGEASIRTVPTHRSDRTIRQHSIVTIV
jgi:hypothetical protein